MIVLLQKRVSKVVRISIAKVTRHYWLRYNTTRAFLNI